MMKRWRSLVLLQLCLTVVINAQEAKQSPESQSLDGAVRPSAVTLSVHGKCACSEDGVKFTKWKRGHIFEQSATIRTGEKARADLFFRRTGTTVRLQAGTEIKIEQMALTIKDGHPAAHILLNLRTGKILAIVHSAVAGSTLEIRNAAGCSVVEGIGGGRYIITADGFNVSDKGSVSPLKLTGENGITIIGAGEQFARKDGKNLPMSTTLWVNDLIQLDDLQAITEGLAP